MFLPTEKAKKHDYPLNIHQTLHREVLKIQKQMFTWQKKKAAGGKFIIVPQHFRFCIAETMNYGPIVSVVVDSWAFG